MSVKYSRTQANDLVELFNIVVRRIINTGREVSSNEVTRERYRVDLITAFNNLRIYIGTFYDKFTNTAKLEYDGIFDKVEDKLIKCLVALSLQYDLPPRFEPINIYLIKPLDKNTLEIPQPSRIGAISPVNVTSIASDTESEERTEHTLSDTLNKQNPSLSSATNDNLNFQSESLSEQQTLNQRPISSEHSPHLPIIDDQNNNDQIIEENLNNMEEQQKFLTFCGTQIRTNYDGNPLELRSFINSVKLLQAMQGTNGALLLQFVKTKLVGKALEALDDEDTDTLDKVLEQLQNKIKPDNSKVIAGRLLALRYNPNRAYEFSKEAELLTEAMQRTLVIEGMSKKKACQETIDKTVELCRSMTASDVVRSIVGAGIFNSPQEVISKFFTEDAKDRAEKQVLAFRTYQQQQKARPRGKGNYRNSHRQSYNNNYGNNGNNQNQNGHRQGRGRSRGRGRRNYRDNNTRNVNYVENQAAPPPGAQQVAQVQADQA